MEKELENVKWEGSFFVWYGENKGIDLCHG